jgi:peroxiredoxin
VHESDGDLTEEERALPRPVDDGGAAHLLGAAIPSVALPMVAPARLDLAAATSGLAVLYFYPATGRAGRDPAPGWERVPGAVGCTAQTTAFARAWEALRSRGAALYGVSTQAHDEQVELHHRLALPFALASDEKLELARALRLPTFELDGRVFFKRLTLIAREGRVVRVFYPVFPSRRNAADVLDWLTRGA